jgi:hypothetical protein
MRIFVTGGTGFVGAYLIPRLLEQGHEIVMLTRSRQRVPAAISGRVHAIECDPLSPGECWAAVGDCDAAINLIGESIQGRWTLEKRERIRQSRLLPLNHLIDAIPKGRDFKLLSASAVGYYGDAGETELDETSPHGEDDFLAELARDWETAAMAAASEHCRVITMRFGMVLGAGGALAEMARAMRLFLGGILGSGRQWASWIHQQDLAQAIVFLLEQDGASGPFNFGAPNPVRQGDFARTLGRVIHRPAGFPTPSFAIRLALDGFADAVLFSQRMRPAALLQAGYEFRYPELEPALREIIDREQG